MSERRYKRGPSRDQVLLLPACVEDYVGSDNPVRAIDAYVDGLDLEGLGFSNSQDVISKGQPAYRPSDLLKLYIYGYLNRVRSSRRLEHETYCNLEVIWLLREIRPSYKTIANFRKDNLSGLQSVNKNFVSVCKEFELFGCELVAIDGSFFRGNASKGSIKTKKSLEKLLEMITRDISNYYDQLDKNDQQEEGQSQPQVDLQEKLEKLKEQSKMIQKSLEFLDKNGQSQYSTTDPDARILKKRGQSTAGYNVQSVVDDKHKLMVVCEVVNDGNDANQLHPMAQKAKEELEQETIEVVADTGYYNQSQIYNCQEEGITPYVAIPEKNKGEDDRINREEFQYDEKLDAYQCPGGHYLDRHGCQKKGETINYKYTSKASTCADCPLKERCLPPKTPYRQIYRYEHEDVIQTHRDRMEQSGRDYMKKRAAMVEHPFGTLKLWLGWTHFLLRGLEKVNAEMSLMMLSYNFKRVLSIIGLNLFREYCLQRRPKPLPRPSDDSLFFAFFDLFIYFANKWINGFKNFGSGPFSTTMNFSKPAWPKFG